MTLIEVIERMAELDDELTIYAAKDPEWTPSSPAVVVREPEDGSSPAEAIGLEYFLEVNLAKDAIRAWSEWRNGREPGRHEKFDAVLYYAEYDAFMPPDLDAAPQLGVASPRRQGRGLPSN